MRIGEIPDAVPYIYKKIMGENTAVYTGTAALSKEPSSLSNRDMPEIEFIFKSSDTEMIVNRDI